MRLPRRLRNTIAAPELGVFLHNRGKYDEAEQILREVVDLREQLHGSERQS